MNPIELYLNRVQTCIASERPDKYRGIEFTRAVIGE
jgi:hypothetical protein